MPEVISQPRDRTRPQVAVSFRYDPLGRRISKTSRRTLAGQPHGKAVTTRFVWEGFRLLQEIRNEVPLTYVYSDPHSHEPLARIDGVNAPDIFWFHNQPNGTPERLTDAEGRVCWEAQNSAWGKLLSERNVQLAGCAQNLRMQGQYLDRETGLHYNLFRYYDPDCGRFTQQDPIGLAGGLNLYQYAPNPLSYIDPLGLAKCKATSFKSRNEAFRAAKRDVGIPMNQQPLKVELVPLTERNGKLLLGDDHLPVKTREYTFSNLGGGSIVIQDHSPGHIYGPPGTPGNQGPHINVRPANDTRNGTIPGTLEHYFFKE